MMFKDLTISKPSLKKHFIWTKRKLRLPFGPFVAVVFTLLMFGLRLILPDESNYPYINYFGVICGLIMMIISIPSIILSLNAGNKSFIKSSAIFLCYGFIIAVTGLKFQIIPTWITSLLIVFLISFFFSIKKPRFAIYYHLVLLERAARPVNSAMDGFTDRPYPAGKFDFDAKAVSDFANFNKMYLIATPFFEGDRTILVLSNGLFQYFKSIKPEFENLTYVSFSPDGSYNVHISRKDYKRYKEQLTFDELCRSLGEVVVDLYNEFRAGKKEKILKDFKYDQHGLLYDV